MIRALVLILAAGLSVGAKRDPLAGRIAGEPRDCLSLSRNTSPAIVDERTILYRESGRRIWRTGPVSACPSLRPNTILIVEVFGAHQICRNDRFRTLLPSTTIPSGYCRFTQFTPYDRPTR
ncbi:hypothetical protein [uncultured Sphingomonas sp.]|uniref:hypothetical protein n=1 Tax=uncultured Sphingomonas sp. TaxID=158754 RepID=UPI0035CA9243